MNKKDKIFYIIIFTVIIIGCYIGLYPKITDSYNEMNQTQTLISYNKDMLDLSQETINQELEKAYKYNEKIYEMWKNTMFTYQGSTKSKSDKEYESLLATQNIMGYVEIESIGIKLPIVHGTVESDLDSMAGHMYLSSLPVGGENTKSIIAAHTGLPTAKLFSDLDKMHTGDHFYICIFNKKLYYEVKSEPIVCVPEEEYHYLQIEEGKDLVALYTCTPYGINDHRLIVIGERDASKDIVEDTIKNETIEINNQNTMSIVKFYGFLLGPAILYIGIILYIILKKKKPKNIATTTTESISDDSVNDTDDKV